MLTIKKLFFCIMLTGLWLPAVGVSGELEDLAVYLKEKKITVAQLETSYSCLPLQSAIDLGLTEVRDVEASVISGRRNTRIAGLLPKISAWGKYRSDDKLYLYQQNNIAVGQDYITIGPDDNNTTIGDINTYEVGAKIEFNLSDLMYNPDTIRFVSEQQKLAGYRMEFIERITFAYYFAAIIKAINQNSIEVPAPLLLRSEIITRKLTEWYKSITKMDLMECSNEAQ